MSVHVHMLVPLMVQVERGWDGNGDVVDGGKGYL